MACSLHMTRVHPSMCKPSPVPYLSQSQSPYLIENYQVSRKLAQARILDQGRNMGLQKALAPQVWVHDALHQCEEARILDQGRNKGSKSSGSSGIVSSHPRKR
ncbi:hypothetical protein ACFX2H_032882 [Malus domestica]